MVVADIKVAVFYDWQNVYMSARRAFEWTRLPNEYGNFSPFALARILAAGNGRGQRGSLVRVEIHRGQPSSAKDPSGFGANRRQAEAWKRESGLVDVRLRPLRIRTTGSRATGLSRRASMSASR